MRFGLVILPVLLENEMNELLASFLRLKHYCEQQNFKGWDPYDGLNSKIFNAIPGLNKSALCRLVVIQAFKRCPFNLRPIAMVPKDYNAKGIGLLLQGYCNLYNAIVINPELAQYFGNPDDIKVQVDGLASLLISLQSRGDYHGACWGYNFDWQARLLFLFPKYTPTVVATCFAATALVCAYEVTKNNKYLNVALSSAQFVINDLHRTQCDEGFLFSYSPLQGNDTVYNASLLGSKILSYCYKYTGNEEFKTIANQSVLACCKGQQDSGAWAYGKLPVQSWVDSFHTGYNLDALATYQQLTGDNSFYKYLEKGLSYYLDNFFEQDGCPKYYDNKKFPIDIHCPAQLFVTLAKLGKINDYKELVNKVLKWTIKNMQSSEGYFYYQLKPGISSKISYMRWSNAFMFYALTYLFNENNYN